MELQTLGQAAMIRKAKRAPAASLHQRILSDLEHRIVSGQWPPGHRLPFEVDLAESYKVSRMTVNKVLTQMAGAGLIERRRKLGSFVAQPQAQSAILEIHDIETEVRSLNLAYDYRLLEQAQRMASADEMASFGLGRKSGVIASRSLHFAGGVPFCLEDRLINLAVVPQAADADFSQTPPGTWLTRQVPWSTAEHTIRAIAADPALARALSIPKHAPCLVVQRRTWNSAGPVTFARFSYPADKHVVVARFTPASSA